MIGSNQAQKLSQFYSLEEEDQPLRDDVRLLGLLLGNTIRQQHGEVLYQLVEEIRQMAKDARSGNLENTSRLIDRLAELESDQVVILARAFALFLNLANIAEQHHQVRRRRQIAAASDTANADDRSCSFLEAQFGKLIESGISPDVLHRQVSRISIELVLTAHPTEIVRRSVSTKFLRINNLLVQRDRTDLSRLERDQIESAF